MMISALAVLLLQAAPAIPPICTTTVAPPPGFEAWTATPAVAIASIAPGHVTRLTLRPTSVVTFRVPPQRKPIEPSFAGVYTFSIPTAGTYNIALDEGAWIDVVHEGNMLQSVGHREGPECTTVRKIVTFELPAGTFTLQLSSARTASMRVLIISK